MGDSTYCYFISYAISKNGATGFGRFAMEASGPIDSIGYLQKIEEGIRKKNDADAVVIINFQRWEEYSGE